MGPLNPLNPIFLLIAGSLGLILGPGSIGIADAATEVTDKPLIFTYDPSDNQKLTIKWNRSAESDFATEILYRSIDFAADGDLGNSGNSADSGLGNSAVREFGNSATGLGNSAAGGFGNSATGLGNSAVGGFGNSAVGSFGNSAVGGFGSSAVGGFGNSAVGGFGNSAVGGFGNSIAGRDEYGMWRELAKAPILPDFSYEFRKTRFCERFEFRVLYNQTAFERAREILINQNSDDIFRSEPRTINPLLSGEVTMLQIPQILDLPEPHWSNRSILRLDKMIYR